MSTTITVNNGRSPARPRQPSQTPGSRPRSQRPRRANWWWSMVQSAPQRFAILVFVDGSCRQGGGSTSTNGVPGNPRPRTTTAEDATRREGVSKRTPWPLGPSSFRPPIVVPMRPPNLVYWVGNRRSPSLWSPVVAVIGRLVPVAQRPRRTWPWVLRVFSVPRSARLPRARDLTLQALTQAK